MTLKISNSKAFTLIETIITTTLILFVITLAASSLFLTGRTIAATSEKNLEEIEKMKVFSQMQKQLTCLYSSENINFSLWGRKETSAQKPSAQIYFLTTMPVQNNGIVGVAYKIIKDENKKKFLGYKEFPCPAGRLLMLNEEKRFEGAGWIELSPLFEEMEIEYYKNIDDATPLTEWEENSIPQKIKITLLYKENNLSGKFSFSVFPAGAEGEEREKTKAENESQTQNI